MMPPPFFLFNIYCHYAVHCSIQFLLPNQHRGNSSNIDSHTFDWKYHLISSQHRFKTSTEYSEAAMVTILIREAIKKIMLGSGGCSSGVRIFSDFFLEHVSEAFLGFIYLEKNMISEEEKNTLSGKILHFSDHQHHSKTLCCPKLAGGYKGLDNVQSFGFFYGSPLVESVSW